MDMIGMRHSSLFHCLSSCFFAKLIRLFAFIQQFQQVFEKSFGLQVSKTWKERNCSGSILFQFFNFYLSFQLFIIFHERFTWKRISFQKFSKGCVSFRFSANVKRGTRSGIWGFQSKILKFHSVFQACLMNFHVLLIYFLQLSFFSSVWSPMLPKYSFNCWPLILMPIVDYA